MKLIVGLGNIGPEYQRTRHNLGFMALDYFADKYKASWQKKTKLSSDIAEIMIDGEKIILIKPLTYYNLVGEAVQKTKNFYKINIDDILVVHDEMAIPVGTIRTRRGGSDAGNNGIKNIINLVGYDFARLRIGSETVVGGDNGHTIKIARRDIVLSVLNSHDQKIFVNQLSLIEQIIKDFAEGSFIETTYRA